MDVVTGWPHVPARAKGAVLAIGNFDGVHRGQARKRGFEVDDESLIERERREKLELHPGSGVRRKKGCSGAKNSRGCGSNTTAPDLAASPLGWLLIFNRLGGNCTLLPQSSLTA
jgi:hypothetical protein